MSGRILERGVASDRIAIGAIDLQADGSKRVEVALTRFRGTLGVDIRLYVAYRETRALGPTAKGIRLAPEHVPELLRLLTDALNSVAPMGDSELRGTRQSA